jgi:hypothetical protein
MHDEYNPAAHVQPMLARFEQLGLWEVAQRLRALVDPAQAPAGDRLPVPPADLDADGLVPLDVATQLLELRSPRTVLLLVDRGVLEGFQRAAEILVSRRSLEHALGSADLLRQRRIEAQIWSLLGSGEDAGV